MKSNFEVNSREEKLLCFLWDKNIPVTSSEMLEELSLQGWKQITLLKTIQSLSEKGYLEIVGLEKKNKTYARKFVPSLSKTAYYSKLMKEKGIDEKALLSVASAIIGVDENTEEGSKVIIKKLEEIIAELKLNEKEC